MLRFDKINFMYEPYPIGLAPKAFEEKYYQQLVDTYPTKELFSFIKSLGNKYSLSEINHAKQYHDYVNSCKPWFDFYQYIKSKYFIDSVLEMMYENHIDLGLVDNFEVANSLKINSRKNQLIAFLKNLKNNTSYSRKPQLSARFEFSMLPVNGGHIKPHTDNPGKIITLVIPIIREGVWDDSFGGGTEVMKPKDITKNFNYFNKQLEFEEVETIKTFEFSPNQCLVFVKTFNSLHAVRPMKGYKSDLMRPTLTINIERQEN